MNPRHKDAQSDLAMTPDSMRRQTEGLAMWLFDVTDLLVSLLRLPFMIIVGTAALRILGWI